jgi:hypothetical protein
MINRYGAENPRSIKTGGANDQTVNQTAALQGEGCSIDDFGAAARSWIIGIWVCSGTSEGLSGGCRDVVGAVEPHY